MILCNIRVRRRIRWPEPQPVYWCLHAYISSEGCAAKHLGESPLMSNTRLFDSRLHNSMEIEEHEAETFTPQHALLIMLYRQWRDAMKVNRLPCSRSPNKLGSGMPCLSTDFHSASAGSRSNHGHGTSDEEAFCRDDQHCTQPAQGGRCLYVPSGNIMCPCYISWFSS